MILITAQEFNNNYLNVKLTSGVHRVKKARRMETPKLPGVELNSQDAWTCVH